jgi:predicted RNA-binding Zn-ribbon protein involved in translation (DUF1610 family)
MEPKTTYIILYAHDFCCPFCGRPVWESNVSWHPTRFNTQTWIYACDKCGFLCRVYKEIGRKQVFPVDSIEELEGVEK